MEDRVQPIQEEDRVPVTEAAQEPTPSEIDALTQLTLSHYKIPVSQKNYEMVRQNFLSRHSQQELDDLRLAAKSVEDRKAGAYIAKRYFEGMDRQSLADPTDTKFEDVVNEVRAEFNINTTDTALDAGALADYPHPSDVAPEEINQRDLFTSTPSEAELVLRNAKGKTHAQILQEYQEAAGETGSVGETIMGNIYNSLTLGIPSAVAAWNVANTLNLELSTLESLSPEIVSQSIARTYYSLPQGPMRDQFFMDSIRATQGPAVTADYLSINLKKYLDNPAAIEALTDPEKVAIVEGVFYQLLDAAPVPAAIGSGLGKGVLKRLSPTFLETLGVSPARAQALTGEALIGPPDNPILQGMGISQADLVQRVLPKQSLEGVTEQQLIDLKLGGDLPEILTSDREVAQGIANAVTEQGDVAYGRSMDESARLVAKAKAQAEAERDLHGYFRASATRITPTPDGVGVDINVVIGKNSRIGFDAKEALAKALELQTKGFEARLIKIVDGVREEVPLPKGIDDAAAVRAEARLTRKPLPPEYKLPDKYYVEVTRNYIYNPSEVAALGADVVTGWKWVGRFRNVLGVPSAWLKRKIYVNHNMADMTERAIGAKLERQVAMVRAMPIETQQKVGEMLEWAAEFGKRSGQNPRLMDLVGHYGPELTRDTVRGYFRMRDFFDSMYLLANKRVYNAYGGSRARSIINKKTGNSYNGNPLSQELAKGNKKGLFFNPETGTIVKLTSEEIDDLYARGGTVLKSLISEEAGKTRTKYLVFDPTSAKNWAMRGLVKHPLKYEPGYFTRIYLDKHFVYRRLDDGEREAIGAAASMKQANILRDKLVAQHPGDEIFVGPKEFGMDNIVAYHQAFDQDTSIFLADRGKGLIEDIGVPAEVMDPINASLAAIRLISKHVAVDDMSRFQFEAWVKQFKDVIDDIKRTDSTFSVTYNDVGKVSRKLESSSHPQAKDAQAAWRYLHEMRGIYAESMTSENIRRAMYELSEGFYNFAQKFGLKNVGRKGRDLLESTDPFRAMRTLSFYDYIKFNPQRQLIIQAVQPIFNLPLAAKIGYAWRWTWDTAHLTQGMNLRAVEMIAGKKVADDLINRNAKRMGLTRERYLLWAKRMDDWGGVANIDSKAMLGDFGVHIGQMPTTAVGRAVNKVTKASVKGWSLSRFGNVVTAGFDVGEKVNVTHSFTLATKMYMKEHKIPKNAFEKLTNDDWDNIGTLANDYAGGMVKANRANWQKNTIGATMLQYLQFTHKSMLTMLGMNRGAYSAMDSFLVSTHQMVGWGASGLPLLPLAVQFAEDHGLPSDWAETLSYGLYDLLLDRFAQTVLDEPGFNMAWTQSFAPGAGTANFFIEMYRNASHTVIEAVLGPSYQTVKGIWGGYQLAQDIMNFNIEPKEMNDNRIIQASAALAEGFFSGVRLARQANLALKLGAYPTQNGALSGVKVDALEAWVRAFTGVVPQELQDYYEVANYLRSVEDPGDEATRLGAQADARDYYERISKVLQAVDTNNIDMENARVRLELYKMMYEDEDPVYAAAFMETLEGINNEKAPEGKDIATLVWKVYDKANNNGSVPQWVLNRLLRAEYIAEDQRKAIVEFINEFNKNMEESVPLTIKMLNEDLERTKEDK